MQSILRWSLENSSPMDGTASDRPPVERKDLDPAIIDLILGKPDSEKMKEDMSIAADTSQSEDERISALDDLEMLIENIDNANDMAKLKLWEPLQSLLTADSSTPEIKTQALWVIGTALQNNPSAQDVYLAYDPLPVLLSFLDPSTSVSSSARAKAIYALSGLLKHNAPAVEVLGKPEVNGWMKLRNALQDPSISVRRKSIFLISSLLFPTAPVSPPTNQSASLAALRIEGGSVNSSPSATADASTPNILLPDQQTDVPADPIHANSHAAHLHSPSRSTTSILTLAALKEHKILDSVISAIVIPFPHGENGENTEADADFEEKAVHLLHTYSVTWQGPLSTSQKEQLRSWIQSEKQKEGEKALLEKWNLSREEYAAVVGKLL